MTREGRILFVVFFTVLLDLIGFGLIIPISPFYAEALGATPAWITLLGAGYSLMQFLFAPFWGRLSDRWGRRPILLMSIAVATVGYVLFSMAENFTTLFLARLLSGFGTANFGAAMAVIADTTPPERRARGMGILGAAFGLGFTLGPALGGFLGGWGMRVPIIAAAILSGLNFLFAYTWLPETRVGTSQSVAGHPFTRIWRLAQNKHVLPLLMIYLFYSAAFSMMEQVLGLFIERTWVGTIATDPSAAAGRASQLTAYALMVVGITAIIVQGGLIGRLVKKHGEKKLLIAGLAMVSVSIGVIPFIDSWSVFLLGMVFVAFGSSLTAPTSSSLLSRATQSGEQGHTMGIGQSLSALGRFGGPAVAGVLFEVGIGVPFWISGMIIVACLAPAILFKPVDAKN